MAEINVRANLLTDEFVKSAHEIDDLIKQYSKKTITIKAAVEGKIADFETVYKHAATAQKDFVSAAKETQTAMQAQINALTGVSAEFKSAKDSAKAFQLAGKDAYRNVAIEAEAAARAEAEAASQQETALQAQINALTGVSKEFKSAKDSASAFRLAGKTAFEEQLDAASKAEKQANSLNSTLKKVGLTLTNIAKVRVFQALTQSMRNALSEMQAVDDEIVTIRKVTGATAEEIQALNADSYGVGSKYGISPSNYLQSVAEFSRAGYKELSSALGELGVKTQLVGDTTQETATQMLLAVDAAYGYEGNVTRLSHVLDGMNELDNNYATSIEKIAEGMGITASVAAQAGVSVNELMAALGTITAVTQRSGSEASRALRSLMLNIMGDTKTEIEDGVTWTKEEIESLRDALNKYAPEVVAAADATKTLINPIEAIGALATSFKEGTLTQQGLMEIVSDLGGKLRSNQLLALIQNWDMYNDMLLSVADSAGSADEEIANAMDSWTRKAQILSNTWTEFVSKTIQSDWIKTILDGLTSVVKWLDNLGNALLMVGGAFTVLKSAKIADVFTGVAGSLSQFIRNAQNARSVLEALKVSFSTAQLAVMGVGAAISAIGIAFSLYESHMNSLREAAQEAAQAAEESLMTAQTMGEDADKVMELAAAYESAAAGNGNLEYASAQLADALGLEGQAVDSLAGKYRDLTQEKINQSAESAKQARSQAGYALMQMVGSDYDVDFGALETYGKDFDLVRTMAESRSDIFKLYNYGFGISLQPVENTVEGIVNYYKGISEWAAYLEKSLTPEQLSNSPLYAKIRSAREYLEENAENYLEALEIEKEASAKQDVYALLGDRIIQTQEERAAFAQELYQASQGDAEKQQLYATIFNAMFSSANTSAIEAKTKAAQTFGQTYTEALAEATEALQTYKQAQAEVNEQGTISSETRDKLLELDEDLADAMRAETDATGKLTGRYVILNDALEDGAKSAQENYDAWKDAGKNTDGAQEAFDSLADSVLNMADEMDRAREAKERLDSSLEGPEVGDVYAEYRDGVERLYELIEQGKIGTKEFSGLFSMFFGEDTALRLGFNADQMRDYVQQSNLSGLFDETNGEASGLLDTLLDMADAQGDIVNRAGEWLATVREQPDGGLFYDIGDAEALADELGVTTEVITSLLDGLRQYGDGYAYTLEEALNLVTQVEGATKELDTGALAVDFSKVAEELFKSGQSLESVYDLMQFLGEAEGVELFNIPGNDELIEMRNAAEAATEALEDTQSAAEALNETPIETPAEGLEATAAAGQNATSALDLLLGALGLLDETPADGPADDIENVGAQAANAKAQVSDVTGALNTLDGKEVSAAINVVQKVSTIGKLVSGVVGLFSNAEGTDNFQGGKTLVNERGPEIIAVHGRAFIAGGGAPSIVNVPRGAIIYNAEDTKKLLTTGIAAKASGTYYKPGGSSDASTNGGKGSGGGTASGGATTSAEQEKETAENQETPDYWSTVEDYVQYAMDKLQWLIDDVDDKIGAIEEERDALTDAVDEEVEALEKISKQIDKQIKATEKERDERIAPIQEQIDLLKEQKDAQDEIKELQEKELAVEEAREALQSAQNERKIRVYNSEGFPEWIADAGAVLEAEKVLENAENELADYRVQMKINALEGQVEDIEDLYDKQISALEDQNEALDEQTEALEERKDAIAEQYEALMEPLEAQKKALQEQYNAFEKQWDAIQLTLSEPAEDVSVALQGLRDTSLPAMSGVIGDVTSLLTQLGDALNITMEGSGLKEPEYTETSGADKDQEKQDAAVTKDTEKNTEKDPGGGEENTMPSPQEDTDKKTVPTVTKPTVEKPDVLKDTTTSSPTLSAGVLATIGGAIGLVAGIASAVTGKFDEGGIASGKGFMQKAIRDDEMVLGPEMTRQILNPQTNQRFEAFTRSLGIMIGAVDHMEERGSPSSVVSHSMSDSHNVIINGVTIGTDQLQRPLSDVLASLNIYTAGT